MKIISSLLILSHHKVTLNSFGLLFILHSSNLDQAQNSNDILFNSIYSFD